MIHKSKGFWSERLRVQVRIVFKTDLFSIFVTTEAFLWSSQTRATVTNLHSFFCAREQPSFA